MDSSSWWFQLAPGFGAIGCLSCLPADTIRHQVNPGPGRRLTGGSLGSHVDTAATSADPDMSLPVSVLQQFAGGRLELKAVHSEEWDRSFRLFRLLI